MAHLVIVSKRILFGYAPQSDEVCLQDHTLEQGVS